jgi:hypothetical protein
MCRSLRLCDLFYGANFSNGEREATDEIRSLALDYLNWEMFGIKIKGLHRMLSAVMLHTAHHTPTHSIHYGQGRSGRKGVSRDM